MEAVGTSKGQQGRLQKELREAVRKYSIKQSLHYLTSSYILLQVAFPATAFSLPPLHSVIFPSVHSPPTHQHIRHTMIYVTSQIWPSISEVQA